MAENSKKQETNVEMIKDTKLVPYVKFRDMTKEQIMALPTIEVKVEKVINKKFTNFNVTAFFNDRVKHDFSFGSLSEVNYELAVVQRSDFKDDSQVHFANLPYRALKRHDGDGEEQHARIEILITRDVIVTDFFSRNELLLLEARGVKLDWIEDKASTKELSIATANVDYDIYDLRNN